MKPWFQDNDIKDFHIYLEKICCCRRIYDDFKEQIS